MRKRQIFLLCVGFMMYGGKCGDTLTPVGFFSDYSKLEHASPASYRCIVPGSPLKRYSNFSIGPVALDWHEGSRVPEQLDARKVTHAELVEPRTSIKMA